MNIMLIIGLSLMAIGITALTVFFYYNRAEPKQSEDEEDTDEIVEIGLPKKEDHLELRGNAMNDVLKKVTDMRETELVGKFRAAADLEREEYVDKRPVDPALSILMGHRLDKEEVMDSDDILLSDKHRAALMRDYENTFYQRLLPFVNSISKSGRLICSSQVIEFLARNYDPIVLPGGQVTVLIVNEITPFVALALESNRPVFLKDPESGVTRIVEASELAGVTEVGSLSDLIESNKELAERAGTLALENEGLKSELHNVASRLKVAENKALKWDETVANLKTAEADMKALLESAKAKIASMEEELKRAKEKPPIVESVAVRSPIAGVSDEEFRRAAESIPLSLPDASDDALTVAELEAVPEVNSKASIPEPVDEVVSSPEAPSAPKKDVREKQEKSADRHRERKPVSKPSGGQKRETKKETVKGKSPECKERVYVTYLSDQVQEHGADMEYLLKTHGIFAIRKSSATDEYMLFLENYRMGLSRKAWREEVGCTGEVRPFRAKEVMVYTKDTGKGFASRVSTVKVSLDGFEPGAPIFDEIYLKDELEEKLENEFDEKEIALTQNLIAIIEEKKFESIEIAVKEVLGE